MSSAADDSKADQKKADEAREALVSDIQELKKAGDRAVAKVGSGLPWVIGGAAVGLLLMGGAFAVLKSRRRSTFEAGARGWLSQAARAAAVSAASILARRLAERALSQKPSTAAQPKDAALPVS
ncbi:MAG TPA: hypothetical protein VER04_25150 [Polyangiaceae bacterium]|nr:hypothetical protein [Polyangiaceae bacterium]